MDNLHIICPVRGQLKVKKKSKDGLTPKEEFFRVEAIKYLSEKDREILLMYFFLGMSDTEIGDRLKINRSTSFRSRKNSLEEIKKKLKENMNDE